MAADTFTPSVRSFPMENAIFAHGFAGHFRKNCSRATHCWFSSSVGPYCQEVEEEQVRARWCRGADGLLIGYDRDPSIYRYLERGVPTAGRHSRAVMSSLPWF
jgi:hypothetical protein